MKIIIMLLISLTMLSSTVYANIASKENIKKELMEANEIVIAAGICNLAYSNRMDSKVIDLLENHNFDIEQYSIKNTLVDSQMILTRYYSSVNKKAMYIVTFRGSSNKKDWSLNLKYGKVPYDNSVKIEPNQPISNNIPLVHHGFNEYVNLALQTKDSGHMLIMQLLLNDKNTDVLITGHSLGGALAILYSARLLDMGIDPNRMQVITFGSPAVGNKMFAELYSEKMHLIRVVTNQDLIPSALQQIGGYTQFGTQLKLAADPRKFDYFDQHSPGFYFHQSIKHYFDTEDKAVASSVIPAEPLSKIVPGKPLVAIHSTTTPEAKKLVDFNYMTRLLLDQLYSLIPSYTTMTTKDPAPHAPIDFSALPTFIAQAKQTGAQFLLLTQIDIAPYKDKDNNSVILNYIIIDLHTERTITAAAISSNLKARNSMLQTLMFDISQLPFNIFK